MNASILLFEHASQVGGGQTVFLDLIAASLSHFDRVGVAYPPGGALQQRIVTRFSRQVQQILLPEIRLSSGRKGMMDLLRVLLFSLRYLPYWGRFRRYDLWYVNGGRVLLPIALAALILRKKIIFHAHLDHKSYEKTLLLYLARWGVIRMILCPSRFVEAGLHRFHPWMAESRICRVIPNALTESFGSLSFENRFGPEESVSRVALVGRISAVKGHHLVCEVALRFPEMTFHFIGDVLAGEEAYARRLRASAPANVIFVGEVTDLPRTLSRLSIQLCLVPSQIDEAFGLVAIEGMACSCITLGTARGALGEIAAETGMRLFDSTEMLSRELHALREMSHEALTALARGQHRRTLETYHGERFATEVRTVFRELQESARMRAS